MALSPGGEGEIPLTHANFGRTYSFIELRLNAFDEPGTTLQG
jgi:hypothetical protein